MKENQCEYCLYLDNDQETGEYYCTMNFDQDELAKLRFDKHASCPYFRMGDDYTIAGKQGVK